MIRPFADDRIVEIVRPYLERVLPQNAPEARTLTRAAERQAVELAIGSAFRQVTHFQRNRRPEGVLADYDGLYGQGIEALERGLAREGKSRPFCFANSLCLIMRSGGLYAAYLEALALAVEALEPNSVREVGFGSGKNLFFLAHRFPKLAISGFELTPQGAALAQSLQSAQTLPANLAFLVSRGSGLDMSAMRGIDFRQSDARALPSADKSVDLSFTMLALEQMWPILPEALAQIRRTTRKHAIFIEAFREANDFAGRMNLWSRNYFRASLGYMEAAGFKPLQLFTTLPSKFTFSAAMLIAEVV